VGDTVSSRSRGSLEPALVEKRHARLHKYTKRKRCLYAVAFIFSGSINRADALSGVELMGVDTFATAVNICSLAHGEAVLEQT